MIIQVAFNEEDYDNLLYYLSIVRAYTNTTISKEKKRNRLALIENLENKLINAKKIEVKNFKPMNEV